MNEFNLFADFLKCVLKSIGNVESEEDLQKTKFELKQIYKKIEAFGKEEAFYEFIKNEYGDDEEIYAMLLQYIYEVTKISGALERYLEMKLEEQFLTDKDLFLELNLREQMVNLLFRRGKVLPFEREWNINARIAESGAEKLNTVYEMIKREDRNQDLVVIFVKVILSTAHTPTRLLLELSSIIQKKLGKKVLIISAVLKTDVRLLSQAGMTSGFVMLNHMEERGNCFIEYKGEKISVYQLMVEKENQAEIKAVWDKIYELKPFCVWNLAADPLWTVIAKQFTTSIYTIMRQGYPAVDADLIVNYIPAVHPADVKNKEILLSRNVDVMETEFLFPYEEPCKNLQRREAGIPEDVFCLGVVGTRLLTECSDLFLEVLCRAAGKDTGIFVIFIGLSEEEEAGLEKKLKGKLERYRLTGMKDDLIEYLDLLDLFVNPPRVGGGNTGAMALSVGVPVLTLDKGDIAAVAGKEFTVETLDDYPEMIWKYKNDSEFYQRQSRRAKEQIEEKTTGDEELAAIIQNVFDRIG